jgi:tetratricopeptide (TPR) repeat protein
MEEGRQLYLEKKYDEAIAKFDRVIELDRTRFLAYVYLARCYIAKSSWGKAIANARLAYQASPGGEDVIATFGEALLGGGLAALAGGQFVEAIAASRSTSVCAPPMSRAISGPAGPISRADSNGPQMVELGDTQLLVRFERRLGRLSPFRGRFGRRAKPPSESPRR